jgi:hypothetical protein
MACSGLPDYRERTQRQGTTIARAGRARKQPQTGQHSRGTACSEPAYITGMEKSAPERMPVGQREVIVLRRV